MKEIAKAINAVMTEVNGVSKDMTVGKGGNSYKGVGDANVKTVIRESMIKNGLSILPTGVKPSIKIDRWEEVDQWSKETPKAMKSKQSVFTDVTTAYMLLHTSGETHPLAGYGQGVDTQDKGAGKATTYALKNTLLNMFLVPTGVDTDDTHSNDIDVPKTNTTEDKKKWLNFEELAEIVINIVEPGEIPNKEQQNTINGVIKEDGYTVSANAKNALLHFYKTGEIMKDLFFPKK